MNTLLKVGLAGLGAYLLFKDQITFALTGKTADAETEAPATQPSAPSVTPPPTKQLVAAAAASDANLVNGLMEFGRWSVYYRQVRGVEPPPIEDVLPGTDPNKKFSIDEWWAAISQAGLNGLGRLGRTSVQKAWGY
jgi:hypothetical protein